MRTNIGLSHRLVLAAGEQPFTLTDSMHPALTECFTDTAYVVGRSYQVFERMFEVAGEVAPVSDIQLQAMQNLRYFLGNRSFLVFTQDTSTPVDQFEIIGEPEGQASGHVLARIACERQ